MNLNEVRIAGNLCRDPELKFTPKGTACCEATVAVNKKWTNEVGEKKESATFVGLVLWGKTAESFAQYLKKGSAVYCSGELKQETWDDKETGKKREKTKVQVDRWQFCGGKPEGGEARPASRPAAQAKAQENAPKVEGGDDDSDSVPF